MGFVLGVINQLGATDLADRSPERMTKQLGCPLALSGGQELLGGGSVGICPSLHPKSLQATCEEGSTKEVQDED